MRQASRHTGEGSFRLGYPLGMPVRDLLLMLTKMRRLILNVDSTFTQ